jgi:SNF2 family DNA or RNA helicase
MRSRSDLRSYQVEGIDFLLDRFGAGLYQDMGLGKTVTALTVIYELRRFGYGPALVIGPIRVIETVWRQEAKEWEHLQDLTFSLVRGNEQQRRRALLNEADIYLINPDLLRWLFKTIRRPYPFHILFVDEASMFTRAGTRRFRALRPRIKYFRRRYTMTGTPMPNRLSEIWPHMYIVDEGKRLCRKFGDFKSRFYEPVVHENHEDTRFVPWEPKEGAEEKIYSLIADVVLRTDAKDHLDLPDVIINRVKVVLPSKARRIYDEVENESLSELPEGRSITAANAAVALMKCRQIANGVVYDTPSEFDEDQTILIKEIHKEKLLATDEVVNETGSPIIIVYNFQHELDLLKEQYEDAIVFKEVKNSPKLVRQWSKGKIPILLLHPKSGGYGLNLQHGGHTMIWFGLTFSYGDYIQTIGRINRQGQRYPVIIHTIIALRTVDILMERVLKAKAKKEANLFGYLKEYRRARIQQNYRN